MRGTHEPVKRAPPEDREPETGSDRPLPTAVQRLSSWGRAVEARARVVRPEKEATAIQAVAEQPSRTVIPRGAGRSYGDASLNEDGVVTFGRLDRLLAFDPRGGTVTCEAGVTLGEIVDHLLPRGFLPPVLPGTRHVTVGGAIASDVHGKNHVSAGAFSSCVRSFRLATPTGKTLTCSRRRNADVFWATLGGMGLTGSIVTATLELEEVESAYVVRHRARTQDLDETIDLLSKRASNHRYAVAWLDAAGTAEPLGRGIVTAGRPAGRGEVDRVTDEPLETPEGSATSVPFEMPFNLVNRATVPVFNSLYYWARPSEEADVVDQERFTFLLDALDDWHRLYGPRGMRQHQSVIPSPLEREGVAALLERVQGSDVPPGLAVLKAFGSSDEGPLSFPTRGVTLSVDVPAVPEAEQLFRDLDRICLEHRGRVYLAKDTTLGARTFDEMYPDAEAFREVKRAVDPEGEVVSSLARRVGLADPKRGRR